VPPAGSLHSFVTPPRKPRSASVMSGVDRESGRAVIATIASSVASASTPTHAVASPPPSVPGSAPISRSPGLSPITSARRPRSANTSGNASLFKEPSNLAPEPLVHVKHTMHPAPSVQQAARSSEAPSSPSMKNQDTVSYNDTSFLDFLSDDTGEGGDEHTDTFAPPDDQYPPADADERHSGHDGLFLEGSIEIEPLESHTPPRESNTRRPAPRTHLVLSASASGSDATSSHMDGENAEEDYMRDQAADPKSSGGASTMDHAGSDNHNAFPSSFVDGSLDLRYDVSYPWTPAAAAHTDTAASSMHPRSTGSTHHRALALEVSPGVLLRSVRSMESDYSASDGSVGGQTIEDVHETLRSMSLLEVSNDEHRRVLNESSAATGTSSLSYSASTYEAPPPDTASNGVEAAAISKNIMFPDTFETPERTSESVSKGIAFSALDGYGTTASPQIAPMAIPASHPSTMHSTHLRHGLVGDVSSPGNDAFGQVSRVHIDADYTDNVVDSVDLNWTFSSVRKGQLDRETHFDKSASGRAKSLTRNSPMTPESVATRGQKSRRAMHSPIAPPMDRAPTVPVPQVAASRSRGDTQRYAASFDSEIRANSWPPKLNSAEMRSFQDQQHLYADYQRYLEFVAFMRYQEHVKQSQRRSPPDSDSSIRPSLSPPITSTNDRKGWDRHAHFEDDRNRRIRPAAISTPSSEADSEAAGDAAALSRGGNGVYASTPGGSHLGRIRLNYSSPLPGEVPAPCAPRLQSPSFEALRYDNVATSSGRVSVPEYRKEMHKLYGYSSISPMGISPSGNAEYWKRRMFVRHHI
jgi:hypothetical protein